MIAGGDGEAGAQFGLYWGDCRNDQQGAMQ
jgi:hypothetical protein